MNQFVLEVERNRTEVASREHKDEAVARAYHKTGFDIALEDDFGSKYQLKIYPGSEQYWDPR